jgi:hypothetical protein
MNFSFSYSNEDTKGNGSTETAAFKGDNITIDKLKTIEGVLKKAREDIYKIVQGK